MSEVAGGLRRRFIALHMLGSEYKVEIEAKIWSRWKQSTPPVTEVQPSIVGEVSHGLPKQRLNDLQVVSIEKFRRIEDVGVEHTTVVAQGRRSEDSKDSDIVLYNFPVNLQM